jgi:hypothetical protein
MYHFIGLHARSATGLGMWVSRAYLVTPGSRV